MVTIVMFLNMLISRIGKAVFYGQCLLEAIEWAKSDLQTFLIIYIYCNRFLCSGAWMVNTALMGWSHKQLLKSNMV